MVKLMQTLHAHKETCSSTEDIGLRRLMKRGLALPNRRLTVAGQVAHDFYVSPLDEPVMTPSELITYESAFLGKRLVGASTADYKAILRVMPSQAFYPILKDAHQAKHVPLRGSTMESLGLSRHLLNFLLMAERGVNLHVYCSHFDAMCARKFVLSKLERLGYLDVRANITKAGRKALHHLRQPDRIDRLQKNASGEKSVQIFDAYLSGATQIAIAREHDMDISRVGQFINKVLTQLSHYLYITERATGIPPEGLFTPRNTKHRRDFIRRVFERWRLHESGLLQAVDRYEGAVLPRDPLQRDYLAAVCVAITTARRA